MAGKVLFKSGAQGAWDIDRTGRINWDLGTKRGGMAAFDPEIGLQREIHNIENAPFRTKFERVLSEMRGPPSFYLYF